ncbi:zinc finger domain-containing protein [Arthrobacter caoxuetaonis]|uniref:DNA-binding phage zinc finger domain-containing protein n=1 Tax=Arthrobacter caoxuetaonis TaxID=2886935 RepID=A0A9X1MI61_9MICC|nr:hypothetical protein [Arthrobacter caoxuetaonis]MCC3299762.1 hypothetical protein [Arthrobacter caoxuetaonis]USQ59337.1 hypothetical protein NF551_17285 [Arthrobacter caoxuetaonis]
MPNDNIDQAIPLDSFDPSGDGWEAMPLADVVAAGQAALASLQAFRLALHGCATPLNLKPTNDRIIEIEGQLKEQLSALEKARKVIETDTALAIGYPGKAPWIEETGGILSPKQILSMASRGKDVVASELTTYRAVVEALEPVPTLLARDRSIGFNAEGSTDWEDIAHRRTEQRYRLVQEILAEIESIDCSSCGAPAGSPCLTAAGGIAHLSHRPRQDAYKMPPEHQWVSTDVNRRPDNQALYPELRGKSWQEIREIVDSRQ